MKLKCSDFAKHVLNTPLWPKQEEILDEYFGGGKSHACWALGRRSGKTLMASIAAVYACFVLESSYKRKVRKNEKWYIVTIANDQQQAKIALNNIRQLVLDSPLGTEITRETATEIEISNGCVFQAIPASARASRGKAVVMCVFDELAFQLEGDANRGAKAIYDALSPSIAQFGDNGRILELSSPWLTDGLFYQHFKEAESGEFPFMQAKNIPTWEINPLLPWGCPFLQAEQKRDEDKFWTEYGARFRGNKSSLLASEIVDAAINKERGMLLPDRQIMGKLRNLSDGGDGPAGTIPSEETKRKIAEAGRGRKHTLESIRKISKAQLKDKNHMWGKTISQETRLKISNANKGLKRSDIARQNIAAGKCKYFCELIDPNGLVHQVQNLYQFSLENGLHCRLMRDLVNGKRNTYKGWTLQRVEFLR
jgi:hypothetical protein